MKLDYFSWLKQGRLVAVGSTCLVAGFLLGLLVFGAPWHLPPNWGDIPTWLAAFFAGIAGVVALGQLGMLRRQVREEAERNAKRDELLDGQLAESRAAARTARRRQAEDITVRRSVGHGRQLFGIVENKSPRPITDITCKVVSKADRSVIADTVRCGQFFMSTGNFGASVQPRTAEVMRDEQSVARYGTLPPGEPCRFTFAMTDVDTDHIVVAWFTDDAGFRWQLDEFQHLTETTGDEYN